MISSTLNQELSHVHDVDEVDAIGDACDGRFFGTPTTWKRFVNCNKDGLGNGHTFGFLGTPARPMHLLALPVP